MDIDDATITQDEIDAHVPASMRGQSLTELRGSWPDRVRHLVAADRAFAAEK